MSPDFYPNFLILLDSGNAVAFLLTTDGVPAFTRTEQGFKGIQTHRTRRYVAFGVFEQTPQTSSIVRTFINLRKSISALRRGDFRFRMTSPHHSNDQSALENTGILAERSYKGEVALVVFNTHASKTRVRETRMVLC